MKTLDTLIGARTQATMRENQRIMLLVSRIVPAASLAHIQFCRIEGGRLRVTVDGAAWVARLRFSERQLVEELRKGNLDVHTVSWHVAAAEPPAARVTLRQANPLSGRSAASLTALAESTGESPADDKLRQELLKLAARLKE